jgi:hypothetical protein
MIGNSFSAFHSMLFVEVSWRNFEVEVEYRGDIYVEI